MIGKLFNRSRLTYKPYSLQCIYSQQIRFETTNETQPLGIQNLLNDSNLHSTYMKYLDRSTYSATTLPIEDAWTLFPEAFTNKSFAEIEKEKIFKRSWIAVGHKCDSILENHGDILSTSIYDIPIIITIDDSNNLRSFYNVCRHRGSLLLSEGKYNKCTVIRCPYHSWSYSCSGKLIGTPYFNDNKMPNNTQQRNDPTLKNEMFDFKKINFKKENYNLFEIGIKEFMGTLFINFDTNIDRREELFKYQFGDLYNNYGYYPYQNMSIIKQFEYNIKSNWKLIAENFIEYYHLPYVHPELCEVSSVANHIRRQGIGQYMGFCTYPLTYGGTCADPDVFIPFEGLNNIDKEAAWFIHIFPNVSYFIYPHHIVSLITSPTNNPNETNEKMTILMDKKYKNENEMNNNEKLGELLDFYVMVNKQDIIAVESVQKGIQTNDRYRGGRFSGKFEEPCYRFQNILIDYITDQYMKEYPGDDDFIQSQYMQK